MSIKKAYIFDLDQTTINSDHRVKPCQDANGDLILEKYISEACTDEKIMLDQLLPLADYMQSLIKAGERVIILTARHCSNSDYYFLRKNGLKPSVHLSRDQVSRVFGDEWQSVYYASDSIYKRQWLLHLFDTMPDHEFILFDDHDGVLAEANKLGITAIDAKIINQLCDLRYRAGYEDGSTDTETEFEDLIDVCLGTSLQWMDNPIVQV